MLADEVPSGWKKTHVGSVLVGLQPGFASGRHNSTGEGLPHFRPMNVSPLGKIDRTVIKYVDPSLADRPERRLQRGDVLFNNTNSIDLVGKTAYFDGPDSPAYSNHMTRLRVDTGRVLPEYLAQYLQACWAAGDFAQVANNHVSQASIGREALQALSIALPPLDEQRRIVEVLDRWDDGCDEVRESLARAHGALVHFRQAIFDAACAGRLTADWRAGRSLDAMMPLVAAAREKVALTSRGKNRVPPPLVAELPDIPEPWTWARLGEVGLVQLGGTPSRKVPKYWGGPIPWVSSGEVANCRVTSTRETITEEGMANSNAKLYPVGTVLIAMIGEGKTRGQAAVLDVAATTNQNSAGVIANSELIDPEYLWRWALGEYEATRAVGRGGNQPALNGKKVRELCIPVPPLEEQREIARRVEELLLESEDALFRVELARQLLERASRTALSKAFNGDFL